MSETGVVKFSCEHLRGEVASFTALEELNATRRQLLQLRMVGVDERGIGFGNVSVRESDSANFYITGSGTGRLPLLTLEHVARVTAYDFARNWLRCKGATLASSESLTHAAVYQADPGIGAVIHGHSISLWNRLLNQAATTEACVEYGTPAMAFEVLRLFEETDVRERHLFAMAGHEGGIVTFGSDLEEAFRVLLGVRARTLSS